MSDRLHAFLDQHPALHLWTWSDAEIFTAAGLLILAFTTVSLWWLMKEEPTPRQVRLSTPYDLQRDLYEYAPRSFAAPVEAFRSDRRRAELNACVDVRTYRRQEDQ